MEIYQIPVSNPIGTSPRKKTFAITQTRISTAYEFVFSLCTQCQAEKLNSSICFTIRSVQKNLALAVGDNSLSKLCGPGEDPPIMFEGILELAYAIRALRIYKDKFLLCMEKLHSLEFPLYIAALRKQELPLFKLNKGVYKSKWFFNDALIITLRAKGICLHHEQSVC